MPSPDIRTAWEHVTGRAWDSYPTPAAVDPRQELADERRIERAQDDDWWDGYASDREQDGTAADYVYGREPALDWRQP